MQMYQLGPLERENYSHWNKKKKTWGLFKQQRRQSKIDNKLENRFEKITQRVAVIENLKKFERYRKENKKTQHMCNRGSKSRK